MIGNPEGQTGAASPRANLETSTYSVWIYRALSEEQLSRVLAGGATRAALIGAIDPEEARLVERATIIRMSAATLEGEQSSLAILLENITLGELSQMEARGIVGTTVPILS